MLVLRYTDAYSNNQGQVFEFITIQDATADTIATMPSNILPNGPKAKLIAQVYKRATVMRGATCKVRRKIMDVYKNAHYLHCIR